MRFQSTLPAGGATEREICALGIWLFQSTLPAGGAALTTVRGSRREVISIHAPRGGSDSTRGAHWLTSPNFNPRSPRGERPLSVSPSCPCRTNFNPRSPRGERLSSIVRVLNPFYFNPRSPRGERRQRLDNLPGAVNAISIHAPRGGSDRHSLGRCKLKSLFQSTLPAGGATKD